ncbi:YceD family protein [Flavobacterium sp. I3-2]|uniref:YceD family protein n=1 Tax=Flavobacterium sp. I3-2 TaxID=2748319 RepID=UPI0015AA1DE0|nr:DUF177 domain-containing protein [Flavobacterium sp. I3-2]
MVTEKDFLIPFIGLKDGKHQFEYHINKSFFDLLDYEDYNEVDVNVDLVLNKKATMLELSFNHKGTVNVPCDVTNEDFDLEIEGNLNLIVKFGEEYNNDNEELLIIPHGEYQINVAHYIYEMIILSVPYKRVNPNLLEDILDEDDLDFLDFDDNEIEIEEDIETSENENENTNKKIDPRWDKLKQLLTDK